MNEKESKKTLWIILVLIVSIAVCGIGGYLIGKKTGASKYKEEIKHYEEQEEMVPAITDVLEASPKE